MGCRADRVLVFALILLSESADAYSIFRKCGEYTLKGYLICASKSECEFVVFGGSNSETSIRIANTQARDRLWMGRSITAKVRLMAVEPAPAAELTQIDGPSLPDFTDSAVSIGREESCGK